MSWELYALLDRVATMTGGGTDSYRLLGTICTTRDYLLTQPPGGERDEQVMALTGQLVDAGWELAHAWRRGNPEGEVDARGWGRLCAHCGAYICSAAMGADQDEAELQPCAAIVRRSPPEDPR